MMKIRSRAPLRLGLAGGGTDVSPYCDAFGGAILNATIGYYAYATIEPLEDGTVELASADQADQRDGTKYSSAAPLVADGNLDLLKHIHNYAAENFAAGAPLSLRLTTKVDVPAGSGLGGSPPVTVAALKAYAEWLTWPIDDYELANAAYVIERQRAQLRGGRQDQYAAAFGGFNFMEFGRDGRVLVNPLRIAPAVVSELEASLLLFYTGHSRSSAAIIEEQARNVEAGNTVAIDAMHQVKQEAFQMKESLLRGDFEQLHRVLRKSWDSKKSMASGIVNERIEALYCRALDAGAYCARVSGAGGGGFMIFLTDPMRKLQVAETLSKSETSGIVYGCHFTHAGAQAWRLK
jgi:D-glycero-alpha-D-manno-heptose-7-phosphate kinase